MLLDLIPFNKTQDQHRRVALQKLMNFFILSEERIVFENRMLGPKGMK